MKLPSPISVIVSRAASSTRLARRFLEAQRKSGPLLLAAAAVGTLTGGLASLFHLVLDWIAELRISHSPPSDPWATWVVVPAGMAVCLLVAVYLVRKLAPEAGGSGVQIVEGALDGVLPMRWRRVIPVKFIGGSLALGSGLLMGREGPSIQMGAAIGQALVDLFRLPKTMIHGLIAAGAGAGLTAAFNAPFAGILFVIEEMRPQFHYSVLSVQAVVIACAISDVVMRLLIGDVAAIAMPVLDAPELSMLWLFVVFGVAFGFVGYAFERFLLRSTDWCSRLSARGLTLGIVLVGLSIGWIGALDFRFVGGGENVLEGFLTMSTPISVLGAVFAMRFFATIASYSTGAPGGLFAPMLALGTIGGVAYGELIVALDLGAGLIPAHFAVAGMGAFFAAVVRAPLTGIILTAEITGNFTQILPLMLTCMAATITAHGLGTRPIYTALLDRDLDRIHRTAGEPQVALPEAEEIPVEV
ncbi:MAG TPA: H(+)/Cl(-) exchange transporter ClcA [Polyangiales bacterium]|nr:H(+)/Cl(-) exchange transporter ClcA [Polyangiales bacterium]